VKERLKPYVKDPYACDLIDRLLWLDPSKRIDSDAALNHDFFWTDPMPCKKIVNLQLQRQRCSKLARFLMYKKIFLFSKRAMLLVPLYIFKTLPL
jgi:hypothetical protein